MDGYSDTRKFIEDYFKLKTKSKVSKESGSQSSSEGQIIEGTEFFILTNTLTEFYTNLNTILFEENFDSKKINYNFNENEKNIKTKKLQGYIKELKEDQKKLILYPDNNHFFDVETNNSKIIFKEKNQKQTLGIESDIF